MRRHKFLTFLLSLLVAIGLWVYAVTVVNPDDTIEISDIRVRVTGTSSLAADGLMLTCSDVQYVDVEIAGRRSDLKELNSSTLEAVANVSNIDKAGTYEVSWTLNPPATVASGDISLVGASSNRITVQVSERRDVEIPIEVEYTDGKPAEGYLCGEVFKEEADISVSGPAEEVSRIARAVVTVDLTDAAAKIDGDFACRFLDADGKELTLSEYVTVSAETAHITVQVLPYRDVPLEIFLLGDGALTSEDVTAVPSLTTVRVTGSEEALEELPDTFSIEVDLAEISGVGDVTLTEAYLLPDGVTRWGETTSRVEVEIRLSFDEEVELWELPLALVTLHAVNAATNMQYSFADTDAVILLRGRKDELSRLKAAIESGEAQIVGKVDISALNPLTGLYPLVLELPGGYAVSVFEEYSVRLFAMAVEFPEA